MRREPAGRTCLKRREPVLATKRSRKYSYSTSLCAARPANTRRQLPSVTYAVTVCMVVLCCGSGEGPHGSAMRHSKSIDSALTMRAAQRAHAATWRGKAQVCGERHGEGHGMPGSAAGPLHAQPRAAPAPGPHLDRAAVVDEVEPGAHGVPLDALRQQVRVNQIEQRRRDRAVQHLRRRGEG